MTVHAHADEYDDCGNPAAQQHLIQGISYNGWTNIDPAATAAQKSISYHPERVIYSYAGLDPALTYKLTVTYLQEAGGSRIQRLESKGIPIHGYLAIPAYTPKQLTFTLPPETYADGRLILDFVRVHGPNAVVSEISISEANAGGPVKGSVSVIGTPDQSLAGAKIDVDGLVVYTDTNGNFSLPDIPQGEYAIAVSMPGYNVYHSTIAVTSNDLSLNIELQPSDYSVLGGTVTDASDGTSLIGVAISLRADSVLSADSMDRHTLTDENGHYSFPSLPYGTYTLEALFDGYQPVSQPLSASEGTISNNFSMTMTASPYNEQEPNNEVGNAGVISLGQPVIGLINPSGDADYYEINISSAGHATISFISVPSNLELALSVQDNTGLELGTVTGNEGMLFNYGIDLPSAGKYFLKVKDGNDDEASWSNYVFKMALASGDGFEPNDTKKESQLIEIANNLFPSIFPESDIDYFHFFVPKSGVLSFSLIEIPANLSLRAVLYSSDFTEVWRGATGTGGSIQTDVNLRDAGVYYLMIEDINTNQAMGTYHLLLNFVCGSDELEPNDSFAQATPIRLGEPVLASIYPQGDADYFVLDLSADGRLNLEIDQVPATIRPNLQIFDEQQELLSTAFSEAAGSGLTFFYQPAEQGKYYLKISDYQNLNAAAEQYRFTILSEKIWFGDLTATDSFSPNNDSQDDDLQIQAEISSLNPITEWTVTIFNSSGDPVKTYTGSDASVMVSWDGTDDLLIPVVSGNYTFRIDVHDNQGNTAATATKSVTIDLTYPIADITAPAENEFIQSDTVAITGSASDDGFEFFTLQYGIGASPNQWEQLIVSDVAVADSVLYNWNVSALADGLYTLRLEVKDRSGNRSTITRTIEIDRVVFSNVSIFPQDFNPTKGESSALSFQLDKTMNVTTTVIGPQSNVVRVLSLNNTLAAGNHTISWDGKDEGGNIVNDEAYFFTLEATYPGTSQTTAYTFSTSSVPYINNISSVENFNPTVNENAAISYNLTANAKVRIQIGVSGATSALRTLLNWVPRKKGFNSELWDGRRDDSSLVGTGSYLVGGWATALPDNAVITTGNRLAFTNFTILPSVITPSFGEICTIAYQLSKDAAVSIAVQDPSNTTVKTLADSVSQTSGEHTLIWDGKDENGNVVCQAGQYNLSYKVTLTAQDAAAQSVTVYGAIQVSNE